MLRITAVEKAKKKGYHLFVEEEYALTISAEVLAQTGLAAGQQITPQRLDEIRQLQYEIVAAIQATNGLLAGISQDISSLESAVNVNTAAINDFNASVSYQLSHR